MKRRDIALAAALLPFASIFAGSTAFAADAGNLKKLRVGVTAGPAAEILEQVVPLAKAKGLDIQIFEFQDYIQPNAALDSGDLDANILQCSILLKIPKISSSLNSKPLSCRIRSMT